MEPDTVRVFGVSVVTKEPGPICTLLLFPSNLKHEVPPNESSDQRISLAFNTFAYGNIGENADNLILINS